MEILRESFPAKMDFPAKRVRSSLLRWKVAARFSGKVLASGGMWGITAVCGGKPLSLILQKQGEDEGWMTVLAGFAGTGTFNARFPTVRRTKGQGSINTPSVRFSEGGETEIRLLIEKGKEVEAQVSKSVSE